MARQVDLEEASHICYLTELSSDITATCNDNVFVRLDGQRTESQLDIRSAILYWLLQCLLPGFQRLVVFSPFKTIGLLFLC